MWPCHNTSTASLALLFDFDLSLFSDELFIFSNAWFFPCTAHLHDYLFLLPFYPTLGFLDFHCIWCPLRTTTHSASFYRLPCFNSLRTYTTPPTTSKHPLALRISSASQRHSSFIAEARAFLVELLSILPYTIQSHRTAQIQSGSRQTIFHTFDIFCH